MANPPLPYHDWIFNEPADSSTRTITDQMGRCHLTIADTAPQRNATDIGLQTGYGYRWQGTYLQLNRYNNGDKVYFSGTPGYLLTDFTIIAKVDIKNSFFFGLHNGLCLGDDTVDGVDQKPNYSFLTKITQNGYTTDPAAFSLSNGSIKQTGDVPNQDAFGSTVISINYKQQTNVTSIAFLRNTNSSNKWQQPVSYNFTKQLIQQNLNFSFYSGVLKAISTVDYDYNTPWRYYRIMFYNRFLSLDEIEECWQHLRFAGTADDPITQSPGVNSIPAAFADYSFNDVASPIVDSISGNNLTVTGTASFNGDHLDLSGDIANTRFEAANGFLGQTTTITSVLFFKIDTLPSGSDHTILCVGSGASSPPANSGWSILLNSTGIASIYDNSTQIFGKIQLQIDVLYMFIFVRDNSTDRDSLFITADGVTFDNYAFKEIFSSGSNSSYELRSKNNTTATTGVNGDYYRLIIFNSALSPEHYPVLWRMGTETALPTSVVQLQSSVSGFGTSTGTMNQLVSLGTGIVEKGVGLFYDQYKPQIVKNYTINPTKVTKYSNPKLATKNSDSDKIQFSVPQNIIVTRGL